MTGLALSSGGGGGGGGGGSSSSELDSVNNAVHLACAAQIVHCNMFGEANPFNGFPEGCQEESAPSQLLALVSMILEGPSIRWQTQPLQHLPSPKC